MTALDSKDLKLLARLQKDGQTSAQELAEHLGMSASQISRRRQRLEAEGYIIGTPCRLNPDKLGLSVQAFIQVETRAQSTGTHQSIKRLVATTPEIVAAWTLTGEADYIFRVYCSDLAALNRLVQEVLLPHDTIGRVHSQIVMDQLKDDTALPLPR
ncbi:Lrp/AsnC family transcriptional regulator [Marivita sp.]|uniref:Lrp/AsnC family transcriptional regulator n=1 Tax=Marivita sp. TaxID=2003365 RepID=UPI003A858436